LIKVPLASTGLTDAGIAAAKGVLESGHLTMGNEVRTFEQSMAQYLERKHFVMVNSGSSANLAIIEACLRPTNGRPWLRSGDSVIVPSIAWPTTVWPLIQLGLNPVFVDIDPETLGLDIDKLEELLIGPDSSGIKGIFVIHPLGHPLNEPRLARIAKRFGIILIADNCESLGARYGDNQVGKLALASSYSFYFSHHITTIEGGGIATDDDQLAEDLKGIRSHGWSRDRSDAETWASYGRAEDSKFLFVSTGFNIRPMEIQAAIGSEEIKCVDAYLDKRREIANFVGSSIASSSLELIGYDTFSSDESPGAHTWMMLPIRVKDATSTQRKKVMTFLNEAGIDTRPVLTGNFLRQPAAKRLFPELQGDGKFEAADRISETSFMIGCHQSFSSEQIVHIADTLLLASKLT
jgi:CDP-6-deoxy-D-xylo-4-hexulose-3-dehydrase